MAGEPEKFLLPRQSDLRYNWAAVRLAALDIDELRDIVLETGTMVVPKATTCPIEVRPFQDESPA